MLQHSKYIRILAVEKTQNNIIKNCSCFLLDVGGFFVYFLKLHLSNPHFFLHAILVGFWCWCDANGKRIVWDASANASGWGWRWLGSLSFDWGWKYFLILSFFYIIFLSNLHSTLANESVWWLFIGARGKLTASVGLWVVGQNANF